MINDIFSRTEFIYHLDSPYIEDEFKKTLNQI